MIQTEFYSTEGCHLCEEAEGLFLTFIEQGIIAVKTIDIARSVQLVESYGLRIPVLKRPDINNELNWPFDEKMLVEFFRV